MAHIQKMAKDGILIAAGPMGDTPTTISGIFIFKAASLDEARSVASQDPTVVEHRNTLDIHPGAPPKALASSTGSGEKRIPKRRTRWSSTSSRF